MTSIVQRNAKKMDGSREALIRVWVVLVEQYTKWRNIYHCAYFFRTDRFEQSWLIDEFSPLTRRFCLVVSAFSQDLVLRLQGLRGTTSCMSLLHLNRLLEDDVPFKTELRVRLVDDEDLAQVEFRNTLIQTGRTGLLCKLHLLLPSPKMPLAVSITHHFILEHCICSNLLSVEKFWVSYLTEFNQCLTNLRLPRS